MVLKHVSTYDICLYGPVEVPLLPFPDRGLDINTLQIFTIRARPSERVNYRYLNARKDTLYVPPI